MDHAAGALSSLNTPSRPALKLQPISSQLFYSTTTDYQHQLYNPTRSDESVSTSLEMNDLGDASGPGSQSHETSISPPPAKRQRRAREVANSSKLPPTRASTRNAKVLSSNSSMTNTQNSTPDIVEASAPPSAAESRASSVISENRPTTRFGKRKLDERDSETPSFQGEIDTVASSVQLAGADHDAQFRPYITIGTPDETESRTGDQEPTVSRRGRPPGSGRGRSGGRGGGRGRGGRGRGLSRQNSGVPEASKRTAGRGGRGKKTSAIHKVQACYDRQSDLKKSYREVARMVRAANDLLAEKDLEEIDTDPKYHEKLPQFEEVHRGLDERLEKAFGIQGRLYEYYSEHEQKRFAMEAEYEQMRYECLVEEVRETAQLRCKAGVLQQVQEAKPAMDEHSSVRPNNHYNYKMLAEERTDIVGLSFGSATMDDASGPSKRGGKKGSPKKRIPKESGVDEPVAKRHSMLSAVTAPPEEPDDGVVTTMTEGPESTALTPNTSTPAPDANIADGDDVQLINFPEKLRRGRGGEPNNRAIVRPWFEFENGEIAFRSLYHEAENGYQQPERFYIDSFTGPAGAGELLSSHKGEDFDQELIVRHRLHPQYGVPIGGSINPDDVVAPTDFSKPLARTRPVCFINKAETEKIETSRSATLVHADQDWKHFERVMAMKAALGNSNVRDAFGAEGLATFDAAAREHGEAHESIDEVLQAAREIEDAESAAPAKRRKTGNQTGLLPPIQRQRPYSVIQDEAFAAPRMFDEIPGQFKASLNRLEVLAGVAERAKQNNVNLPPNPTIRPGIMPAAYPPPRPQENHSASQGQSSSKKRKYSGAQAQSSPRMMMPLGPPAQTVQSQSMAPPPPRTQNMNSHAAASHAMASPMIAPQPIAPQVVHPRPISAQSMGPPHGGIQSMGPPGMGTPSMAPQHVSPQAAGPLPSVTQNMALPPVAPQRIAQKLMGSLSVLPQPTSSSFTRSRSTSDQNRASQSMLPPPTPSQLPNPHLGQAQGYYPAAQQQSLQNQHMQQLPPPHQSQQHQHPQPHQPPQQHPHTPQPPTSRSHRSGPSNSGLRDILPRPDLKASSPRAPPSHGNRHIYENNSNMPPYQGPSALPPVERGYGFAASDPGHQSPLQYGPSQHRPSQQYHGGPSQYMGSPLPPHQPQPMQAYHSGSSYHNSSMPKQYQDYPYGQGPQAPLMRNPDPYTTIDYQFQRAESPQHKQIVEQQLLQQRQAQQLAQQQAQQQVQQRPQLPPPGQQALPKFFPDT